MALACEVVSEDHITRSKMARGAIADPDFHLSRENENVLSPGRGVPIAPIVRKETAEHEVGTRLKRNVVALLGRQRQIFKMGLAVVTRIYPYDHARAPSHREIIVPGRDRTLAREGERIEPKMALQMNQPPTGNLSEFAAVDRVQSFFSGEKSLNRAKPRRIAAVDHDSLIPIAPVGGAECVTAHLSDLIP